METVIRVLFVYVFLLVGLRIMGKREFSQLSPLELVTLLLIPELVSQGILREDFSLTNGLIAVATLFSLVFLSSLLQYHSTKISYLISGNACVLVEHGRFVPAHLNKERISPEEIYSEMRRSGLERLEQVKWAILETEGKISIIPFDREEHPPEKDDQSRETS
jgi:uncharacterized membrane protein YcaP (DUF421 family)